MPLIVISLIGGAAFAIIPYAFAEDSRNPIAAIWDAIYDLQNRDQNLQVQIDDLRTARSAELETEGPVSDPSVTVQVHEGESAGQVVIDITVANSGPDRAAGVRLMAFYKMPLLEINSVSGEACADLSRGIIQCDLGTIESGDELVTTIDASALSYEETSLIADISSITEDVNTANNRSVVDFAVSASGLSAEDESPTNDEEIGKSATVESNQTSTEDDEQSQEQDEGTPSGNQTSTNETNSTSSESSSTDQSDSDASSDDNATESEQSSAGTNSTSSSSENSSDDDTTESDEDDEQSQEEQGTSSGNQTSSTG